MDRKARMIENMVKSYGSAVSPEQAAAFRNVLRNHQGPLSDFNYLSNEAFENERVTGFKGKGFKQLANDINKLIGKGPKPTSPVATPKPPVAAPKPPIPRANPSAAFSGIVDKFNQAVPKPTAAPTPAPRGGLRMPTSGFRAPNIPGASATKTVLNAPTLPKGFIKGGIGPKTFKGGLVETAIGFAAQPVIDFMSREAVRGAQVVTGLDTTNYDNLNAGRPVVKNINGVSYNIATPEGLSGYQKAMKAGGKESRTGSVDTPTDYPTEAVTKTIKPSRDYQKEAGERTSSEGVAQYGQTLGGLNTFNKGFLGEGYDLTDIQSTYQSEALPATLAGITQLEKPLVEGATPTQKPKVTSTDEPSVPYGTQLPEGGKPFASTDSYTPYSTGGNPSDAQDGTSPQPDRVERLRQIGFNGADFSGAEPDDSTLVSPMYANKKRNEIRRTFLDYEGSSVKAAVAANAVAGFGKDSNGDPRFNYGGELVNAKEGMEWKAKDAAMRGVDPTEFLQTKIAEVKDTATSDVTTEDTSTPEVPSVSTPPTSNISTPGLSLEEGNTEYAAIKFVRDPKTNSMVPAK